MPRLIRLLTTLVCLVCLVSCVLPSLCRAAPAGPKASLGLKPLAEFADAPPAKVVVRVTGGPGYRPS